MHSNIVAVDLDDVLTDLLSSWLAYLNNKYNKSYTRNDVKFWDMKKNFPELTEDQIYSPFHDVDFWESMKPVEGAQEYVPMIQNLGYKVIVVTATHPQFWTVKYRATIQKYFSTIPSTDIILAYDKSLIRASYRIDDNVNNLCSSAKINFLFVTAPHNENIEAPHVTRVHSWKEIYEVLKKELGSA